MWTLTLLISNLFDLCLAPFASLAPIWGLGLISFITGVGMLAIYRYTSNQVGIKRTKGRMKAYFIEIRLYQDDLFMTLKAVKNIIFNNFVYMKFALVPMLYMIVPVILILVQLNLNYAFRGLQPGDEVLVQVKLRDGVELMETKLTLQTPAGVTVQTPPVRIISLNEIDWRIKIDGPTDGPLEVLVEADGNQTSYTKEIFVSDQVRRVSTIRTSATFMDALLNPGEAPLPDSSPIESITVFYPAMQIKVCGMTINWLVLFFILSIVFGFACKDLLGVEI